MKKIIDMLIVAGCLVIAFLVYKNVNPENFVKADTSPVSAKEIDSSTRDTYIGRVAGDDVPRLTEYDQLEGIIGVGCMTVETTNIIKTGIYGLKPWVDPYEVNKTRTSTGRMVRSGIRAPEVTDNIVQAATDYQEYYLVELPDQSMVLAQFSPTCIKDFHKGKAITLPIGYRKTNSNEAKNYLASICDEYGADNTYTLYMVNDEWQKNNDFKFFIIRFAIAAVVFFVLGTVLICISNKFGKQ